jgi:hypothetical protein
MATLDGNLVLGVATTVVMTPIPNAQQITQYFGISGQQTIFGGTRGRTLRVTGVLYGKDLPTINVVEQALLQFADGNTHTLIDDRGRVFPNVIFLGEYTPFPQGPKQQVDGSYFLPYTAVMHGLS